MSVCDYVLTKHSRQKFDFSCKTYSSILVHSSHPSKFSVQTLIKPQEGGKVKKPFVNFLRTNLKANANKMFLIFQIVKRSCTYIPFVTFVTFWSTCHQNWTKTDKVVTFFGKCGLDILQIVVTFVYGKSSIDRSQDKERIMSIIH